jgi:hypothetical protein
MKHLHFVFTFAFAYLVTDAQTLYPRIGITTITEDTYFDNQWDIGFHVGLGALILKSLQIECRYGLGMVNLMDDSESKNRCFQISLATPLQLKR